jgi:hypothetical protein
MQIKETAAMRVLSSHKRLSIAEIRQVAAEVTPAIAAEAARLGLLVDGPWTFVAHGLPKDGHTLFDLRFCLPVRGDAAGTDSAFELIDLEPIMVAASTYQGPLRSLFTKGYRPLVTEIENSRHIFSGESREIYHDWGHDGAGYQKIEIQFGLAR